MALGITGPARFSALAPVRITAPCVSQTRSGVLPPEVKLVCLEHPPT